MHADTAVKRCRWCGDDPLYIAYHDSEWGVPCIDDHKLFEFLVLEGAQAGLNWITILRKREGYRRAFANFDPVKVSRFTPARIDKLLRNPAIVRNRLKVRSAVNNARAFLAVQKEFGSFAHFLWRFVDGRPQQHRVRRHSELPATSPTSDALSRELKQRGFSFVGSTICYAYMQAMGLVNDHVIDCHRYAACRELGESFPRL